jgi:hypothetical protein
VRMRRNIDRMFVSELSYDALAGRIRERLGVDDD